MFKILKFSETYLKLKCSASPLEETALKTMYSQSNERVSSIFVDYALHHLLKTMFVSVPPQKFEPL